MLLPTHPHHLLTSTGWSYYSSFNRCHCKTGHLNRCRLLSWTPSKDQKGQETEQGAIEIGPVRDSSANMSLRLSEICKDFLTFSEKDTAWSFLPTLAPFLLLQIYKNGTMLDAWSFCFGSAVLGSSVVCRYHPKHHLAKQRRPTRPSEGMVRHWLCTGGLVHDTESLPRKRTKQKPYTQYQVWGTLASPLRNFT